MYLSPHLRLKRASGLWTSVISFWFDYYNLYLDPLLLSDLVPDTLFVGVNYFIIPQHIVLFCAVNPNPPVVIIKD